MGILSKVGKALMGLKDKGEAYAKHGTTTLSKVNEGMSNEGAIIHQVDGDVYSNYRWAVKDSDHKQLSEVPLIQLVEFQPDGGPILEDLAYLGKLATAAAKKVKDGVDAGNDSKAEPTVIAGRKPNAYEQIYSGIPTGNIFLFPFFGEYNHRIASTWSDSAGLDIGGQAIEAVQRISSVFDRGIIEKRRNWQGTSQSHYPFSFTLYNTYSEEDILQNLKLIRALINNNLPSRTSFSTMLPPCFYALEIPGVRYSPVVAFEGVDVENIGQVNRKNILLEGDQVMVNIPDAWRVTISIHELHTESREIYDGTFHKTGKVRIINEKGDNTKINKFNIPKGSF